MKGRMGMWVALAALAAFVAAGAFVGYKLWKRQQARALIAEAQRWEIRLAVGLAEDLDDSRIPEVLESQNERLDRYEVLRPVVDELDLIAVWQLPGPEEAMATLREISNFRQGEEPRTLEFVVSDKDKQMASDLAKAISRNFEQSMQRDRLMPSSLGE